MEHDEQARAHHRQAREAGAAILAKREEWRWNAGHKAVTALWTESIEATEKELAHTMVEHIEAMTPNGPGVLSAITKELRRIEPSTMGRIDAEIETDEGAPAHEHDKEALWRALCDSEAMRKHYVQAIDNLVHLASEHAKRTHA